MGGATSPISTWKVQLNDLFLVVVAAALPVRALAVPATTISGGVLRERRGWMKPAKPVRGRLFPGGKLHKTQQLAEGAILAISIINLGSESHSNV